MPLAHRTIVFALKGLEQTITLSAADPITRPTAGPSLA
jgi:glutathionyl-hydroquinone reductase